MQKWKGLIPEWLAMFSEYKDLPLDLKVTHSQLGIQTLKVELYLAGINRELSLRVSITLKTVQFSKKKNYREQ